MNQNDIDDCLAISFSEFGKNYHKSIYFELKNRNHSYYVAIRNENVIGFSIVHKFSGSKGKNITNNNIKINSEFHYLIDVIAIKFSEQKKGIGSTLLKKMLKELDKKIPVYSVAWKDLNGINIEKLYKNNNLIPVKGLGKIWRPNCNIKFICPSYNNGCQCEGLLFKLTSC
jgi:hypothetical protein